MVTTITVNTAPLQRALQDFAQATGREVRADMRRHSRSFMRYVVSVTPPAQGTKATGAEAYRTGRAKIARQMHALLVPVRIKGRRIIRKVFGHDIRPVSVPTTEQWPDVAGLYRRHSRTLTNRIGYRIDPKAGKFYVDRAKFAALLKAKQSHVGRLMSGWMHGLLVLGLPVPLWVRRHGPTRGRATLQENERLFRFRVANVAVPAPILPDLDRRVAYAVDYTASSIQRQAAAIMARQARRISHR